MAHGERVRLAVDEVRKELELITSPMDACAILLLALSNRGEPDEAAFADFVREGVGSALGRYLEESQIPDTVERLVRVGTASLATAAAGRDDHTVEVNVGAPETRIMVLSGTAATANALRLTQGDHVDLVHVQTEQQLAMGVAGFAPRVVLIELDHFAITDTSASVIADALAKLEYRVLCVMWGSDQEAGAELARALRNRGIAEMLIDRSEGVDAALEVLRAWMT